ncbi:STAS domain-containing protein [Microscilla marina]|uniref:Anti-sigma factor antagonist n=1 Tax=Microscilla marina ATCC 23134 TaxID=313606 RepID=A1ZI72_MICM2|nr:STAS domain-containing protein [Microscilla marina]EAY29740.1 anti-anti-sigma factor, putative [Microscilla marina ATCC 23134]
MQIKTINEEQFHIIEIYGDVDASSSITLDKSIEEAITNGKKNILVDCANLNYISSAGLGVFMSHIEEFKEKEIFFTLFGLSSKVKNVFEILGLDQLLQIVDSKQEAKDIK